MDPLGHLIEKHFKRRELDQQLLARCRQDEAEARTTTPVITISRELGSGGRNMGQMVANDLGFAFYDRDMLDQIAAEAGSSSEHIGHLESGQRDAFTGMLLNILDRRHVTDTQYLRSLTKVLRRLAEDGRAVIMGRGGACVLREALKVRVIAPFDLRVQRMAVLRGISAKEAEQLVVNYDFQQRRFLRTYFGCGFDDPLLFDLIINTEVMSLEHGAELILTRARQLWPEEKS